MFTLFNTHDESTAPADIVLVLDQSGSMARENKLTMMKSAVTEFVDVIAEMNTEKDDKYRVAIVGFGSQNENTEILTAQKTTGEYKPVEREELDTKKIYYTNALYGYSAVGYSEEREDRGWWGSTTTYPAGWYYLDNSGEPTYYAVGNNANFYELVYDYTGEYGVAYNSLNELSYASALVNCTSASIEDDGVIGEAINELAASGATRADFGMQMAQEIFANQPKEYQNEYTGKTRAQVVVFITDGVPTKSTDFDSDVAEDAIAAAGEMKDDGAYVYSIYIGSPADDSQRFMQLVSSNYPNAKNWIADDDDMPDPTNTGYYSASLDAESLTAMFNSVLHTIQSDAVLNEKAVVSDVLTEEFKLPSLVAGEDGEMIPDPNQIKVYTVDYLGNDNWSGTEEELTAAQVKIGEDGKSITVEGFDFAANCVTEEEKVTGSGDYGRKLVFYIPVVADTTATFGGYLPTNEEAGIYKDEAAITDQEPLETAEACYDDVAISYTLVDTSRAYHLNDGIDTYTVDYTADYLNAILAEMIPAEYRPDGTNNAGVTMSYALLEAGEYDEYDPMGSNEDDTVLANLTVPAGENYSAKVVDFREWTKPEGAPSFADIILADRENFAEKLYILACRLTTIREGSEENLLVYAILDIAVTRDSYVVYGVIDENGSLKADPVNQGVLFNNTYTETVEEGQNSAKMTFTPNEGYEISKIVETITKYEVDEEGKIKHNADGSAIVASTVSQELALPKSGDPFEYTAESVYGDVSVSVTTEQIMYKLTTISDANSAITPGFDYPASDTETVDAAFQAMTGRYITEIIVDGKTVYEYTENGEINVSSLKEAGVYIHDSTESGHDDIVGVYDKNGHPISVIVAGDVVVDCKSDHTVEVKADGVIYYKLTYNYYDDTENGYENWSGNNKVTPPEVSYVTYGDSLPQPTYAAGASETIDSAKHNLSSWHRNYNGNETFTGVVDPASMTMPAHDLDLHAYWSENDIVVLDPELAITKTIDTKRSSNETFTFVAKLDDKIIDEIDIVIAAGKRTGTATFGIELDAEQQTLKNMPIVISEVIPEEGDWIYDESVYKLYYTEEDNDPSTYNYTITKDGILEDDVLFYNTLRNPEVAATKTVVQIGDTAIEDGKVGDVVAKPGEVIVWKITVTNKGNSEGVFLLEDRILNGELDPESDNEDIDTIAAIGVAYEDAQLSEQISLSQPLELEAGDTADYYVTYTVDDADCGNTLYNYVNVNNLNDPDTDPKPKPSEPVPVVDGAELSVAKEVSKINEVDWKTYEGEVSKDDTITWTITVTNSGDIAGYFTLEDVLSRVDMDIEDENVDAGFMVSLLKPETDAAPEEDGEYEGYYKIGADAKITFTVEYKVLDTDAATSLINYVKITEPDDDPEEEPDPDKEDESDPVEVAPYTVIYTDGVDGEEVFEDQVTTDLKYGDDTPEFMVNEEESGEPTREGWLFKGWDPEVEATVTGHAVYTAQWEKIDTTVVVTEKTVKNDVTKAEVGDTLYWDITVENLGNVPVEFVTALITDTIKYKDDNGDFVELDGASAKPVEETPATIGLGVKEDYKITVEWVVTKAAEGKTLKNYAVIGDDDEIPSEEVEILKPDLSVDKYVYMIDGEEVNEEELDKYQVVEGTEIQWMIRVVNNGEAEGSFVLADILMDDEGMEIDGVEVKTVDDENLQSTGDYDGTECTLEAEEEISFLAVYTVKASDEGTSIVNRAELYDPEDEPKVDEPIDEDESEPVPVDDGKSKLTVKKTANRRTASEGDWITYTIVVSNDGDYDLKNITVIDEMLDVSEPVEILEAGESLMFEYKYKVRGSYRNDKIVNVVVVEDENGDPIGEDDCVVVYEEDDPDYPTTPLWPLLPEKPDPKPDPKPEIPNEPAIPETPVDLNIEDHFAYIIGYPDGTVRPEREITRAEVATIFFRMLTDEARERYWSTENDFTDVAQGDWYNNAISTLTKVGVINGYPDGTFRPNASITRAEIVKIAVSFFDFVEANDHLFSDVDGHWAESYIAAASEKGLINGYPDGTFKPDRNVTRAEAVTIINNVLGRKPCKDRLLDEMIFWPDNADEDMWYYEAIQEATNSHEYVWEDLREKLCEQWTRLLPVRDWATLERAWAANMAPNPGEVMNNP